jgi:TRAP-type mannitol/chloroaromatic compound transport system permease small subunit
MGDPTKIDSDIRAIDPDEVESAAARAQRLEFPRTWLSDGIEAAIHRTAAVINWIWVSLVLIIVTTVAMRYVFAINTIWIEEVQWHLYAIGFMFGIGYAILYDAHVRVDVIAANLGARTRATIELLMILFILLPFVWIIISYAIPFVEASWRRGERSSAPGGLGARWAIKAVIIAAFVYIGLAAFARLLRVSAFLFGFPRPRN